MPKREITYNEVLSFLERLPYHKFKEVVNHYSVNNKSNFEKDLDLMITLNFQQRLEVLGINKYCPKCLSANVIRYGKRASGVQVFQCKDCSTIFTLFTGTILEKTKWHWDIWIKVLEMTLNGYSIDSMLNVLKKDFGCSSINRKTVWLWRIKLIHAISSLPTPNLTGVIQIDETFIRESQKGSRKLLII
jgi:transposase-like protein